MAAEAEAEAKEVVNEKPDKEIDFRREETKKWRRKENIATQCHAHNSDREQPLEVEGESTVRPLSQPQEDGLHSV
jgi:hypothetical protein